MRCFGAPGDTYILSAVANPSPFGPNYVNKTEAAFVDQPVVGVIEIEAEASVGEEGGICVWGWGGGGGGGVGSSWARGAGSGCLC